MHRNEIAPRIRQLAKGFQRIKIKKERVIKLIEARNKSLVLIFFVSIQDALA